MPKLWQIAYARAAQTQGVWTLNSTFEIQGKTQDVHLTLMEDTLLAATDTETADNTWDSAQVALNEEYSFFKSTNSAVFQRLDSEVPDTDALQKDIDQIGGIVQRSEPTIDDRTLRTVAAWKKVNATLAAAVPPRPAVVVRGITQATYETRWNFLPEKKMALEVAAAAWREKNNALGAQAKKLDRLNKDWYQAWKSEYPAGTPQGDALAGVDTEEGTALPQVLVIAAVVQQGLSLKVTYDAASGKHATVKELLFQIEGVNVEPQRVAANVAEGNVIGPFTVGQVIRLRTDVGNSRDASELSPELVQTVV